MNVTNWTAITNFDELLTETNRFAPFWLGILILMWVVLVVTFLPFGTNVAIIGGSFLALILGILLAYMGLVGWKWVLMIVGTIILIVILDALFAGKEK